MVSFRLIGTCKGKEVQRTIIQNQTTSVCAGSISAPTRHVLHLCRACISLSPTIVPVLIGRNIISLLALLSLSSITKPTLREP